MLQPTVSHVRPIVRYETGIPHELNGNISTPYCRLNVMEFQECGNSDDYIVPTSRTTQSATKEYHVTNNAVVNEYLEVVGEDNLNSNELNTK